MNTSIVDRPDTARSGSVRIVVTAAVVAVLIVTALVLNSVLGPRRDRPPYGAAALDARVQLQLVAPGQAQAAVDRLAGAGRLTAPIPQAGQQQIVGQLTFHTPRNAPQVGQYALFIIDRAQGKPVSAVYATGPAGTDVSQGWDGRYDKVAAKYPWLHMLASIRTPDGLSFTNSGMAVNFAPDTAGPVTFTALLDPVSLPITDPAQQLTVALVFISSNDLVYWATKLAG
jgi:hypothetical protein